MHGRSRCFIAAVVGQLLLAGLPAVAEEAGKPAAAEPGKSPAAPAAPAPTTPAPAPVPTAAIDRIL